MTEPMVSAQARAQAILAGGGDVIYQLGQRAAVQTASALGELDRLSHTSADLMAVNLRLVPLLSSFKLVKGRQKWWHWFNGESLAQDVFSAATQQEIQALVAQGEQARQRLLELIEVFAAQRALMGQELALLDLDIAAGRLILTSAYAEACRQAGLDSDGLNRLSRRLANLETSAVATRLAQAQYQVAMTHATTVVDRFSEIYTLLLPIWEQAMGFELLARRLGPHQP